MRQTRLLTGALSAFSACRLSTPPAPLCTRKLNGPESPWRITQLASCDQNCAYRFQCTQLSDAVESVSAANTALRPKPYCQSASRGEAVSLRLIRSGTAAPSLGTVVANSPIG